MKYTPQSSSVFSLSSGCKVHTFNFLHHITIPKNLMNLIAEKLIQDETDELELKYENIRV